MLDKVCKQTQGVCTRAHNELGLCAYRFGGSSKWIEISRATHLCVRLVPCLHVRWDDRISEIIEGMENGLRMIGL